MEGCLRAPHKASRLRRRYDAPTRRALGAFTWFIYRIREPAMRNLFMSPRNWFRMEEAVLSLLAGGVFDGWPVRGRLYLFRLIYYITKLSLSFRCRAPEGRERANPPDSSERGIGGLLRSDPELQYRPTAGGDGCGGGGPLAAGLGRRRWQHGWLR